MCTSIAMKTADFYFGRNMDLEYDFGQSVVVTPREYPFHFRCDAPVNEHPAMIGMATVAEGYPLYADAVNEYGLCIAALHFPENARYFPQTSLPRRNIAPFELIPWLLCHCKTAEEARVLLGKTQLVDLPFSQTIGLSPLHWHIADCNLSIVVESTASGLQIYDNPAGVLTNNPPFPFHLSNLCRYMQLTPEFPQNRFCHLKELTPYGGGMGAIGLPGDSSSPSRFVRAAYLRDHSRCKNEESASVAQFFHLLSAVEMVRGSVVLPDGSDEITRYSACMNASRGIYYYTTYENRALNAVELHGKEKGSALHVYPLPITV